MKKKLEFMLMNNIDILLIVKNNNSYLNLKIFMFV
jgi:hypothetical protein